jgi:DNA-binding XRE family transcriptional regulator
MESGSCVISFGNYHHWKAGMKTDSTLRKIREATGLKPGPFATVVGTTADNIRNIERGLCKPSPQLRKRIAALTGAEPGSIANDSPRDFEGRPYSPESFREWQECGGYTDEKIEELIGLAINRVSRLCLAASHKPLDKPAVLRPLLIALNDWIFEKVDQHNLGWIIEKQTADGAPLRSSNTTVGELRKIYGERANWQKIDRKEWKDSDKAACIMAALPAFFPFIGFGSLDGQKGFFNCYNRIRHNFQVTVGKDVVRFSVDKEHGQFIPITETPPPSTKQRRKA